MGTKLWYLWMIFCILYYYLIPPVVALDQFFSNGDVFLAGSTCSSSSGGVEGLLQIHFNNKTGAVCHDNFNSYAADAACRELGFVHSKGFKRSSADRRYNTSDVRAILTNVHCPKEEAKLHLLRCEYSTEGADSCPSDNLIILTCESEKLREDPYDSQVFLKDQLFPIGCQTPSEGVLQIYLNDQYGYVCGKDFTLSAADAVCLQKGFTNALSVSQTDTNSPDVVWLSGVNCSSSAPQSCLNKCFTYPGRSDVVDSCYNNALATVRCTFNTSLAQRISGSKELCDLSYYTNRELQVVLAAVLVTSIVLMCIVVISILVTCYFFTKCPLYMYRRRRYYRSIV